MIIDLQLYWRRRRRHYFFPVPVHAEAANDAQEHASYVSEQLRNFAALAGHPLASVEERPTYHEDNRIPGPSPAAEMAKQSTAALFQRSYGTPVAGGRRPGTSTSTSEMR